MQSSIFRTKLAVEPNIWHLQFSDRAISNFVIFSKIYIYYLDQSFQLPNKFICYISLRYYNVYDFMANKFRTDPYEFFSYKQSFVLVKYTEWSAVVCRKVHYSNNSFKKMNIFSKNFRPIEFSYINDTLQNYKIQFETFE